MSNKKIYDVGDVVRCSGTFSVASVNVDPAAVFFKFKTPAGAVTTYIYGTDAQLVKSATGIYYADVAATEAGDYAYRIYATGNGKAAAERQFEVRYSLF